MREIEARLKLSAVDKTGAAFNSLSKRMELVNRRTAEFNKRYERVAKVSKRMALVAPTLATVTAAAMRRGIVDFAELERQMNRIGITAEASAEETSAAFQFMQQETKRLGVPLQEGIAALDTMTASGMNLQEAMAMLPSVMMTLQASGAGAEDIANAGLKVASAFKIEAKNMQHAFDLMAYSGKNGQFELNNMAAYLPRLSTLWSSLGYSGEEGLKPLLGMLQTLRAHAGTAEEAATYAQNVMLKMTSNETVNNFRKMGINLEKSLAEAKASGEDLLDAFVRISKVATKGDISKFNKLFTDSEVQIAMKILASNTKELAGNIELLNSTKVDGTNFRDAQRIMTDTQSSIERVTASYREMTTALGERAAPYVVPLMDKLTEGMTVQSAKEKGMEKLGWSWWRRQIGPMTADQMFEVLNAGGYADPRFREAYQQRLKKTGQVSAVTPAGDGRQHYEVVTHNGARIPVPVPPPNIASGPPQMEAASKHFLKNRQHALDGSNPAAQIMNWNADFAQAEQAGNKAGKAIGDTVNAKANQIGSAIGDAISARVVSSIKAALRGLPSVGSGMGGPGVNADTGRSMPPSAGRPASSGG